MEGRLRWDPCVVHYGDDVNKLIECHFTQSCRKIFFLAGAGFDPRSRAVAERFARAGIRADGLLIREERPDPLTTLSERAEANVDALRDAVPDAQLVAIDVFARDGATVGGRRVVNSVSQIDLDGITDVVVDVSALSAGISFPIIRYFVEYVVRRKPALNFHVFIAHDPCIDDQIRPIADDKSDYIHGFKGLTSRSDMRGAARLWMPQLAKGMGKAVQRLHQFVEPDDTCPILPFPATDPKSGDRLVEEYLTEMEDVWTVDERNIVYADQGDPLDVYRTILRLDDLRKPIFAETGGSMLILSPLGSKLMAVGALMAALERDLPVAYLEAVGYWLESAVVDTVVSPKLIHLWLEGEVYSRHRAPLPRAL